MYQSDRDEFNAAINKELQDQMKNGNFTILQYNKLPKGTQVLPTV